MARINFVELPTQDVKQSKTFYASAFGFSMTDFGPTYACTLTADVDLGLQGDQVEVTRAPLVVIDVEDLERAYEAVIAAGGTISKPTFSFPGGRRFHFIDPAGNELAVAITE